MNLSEVCIADLRLSADELNELVYGTERPYIVFAEDPEDKTGLERFIAAVPQEALKSNVPRISGKSKFLDGANKIRDLSLYRKFPDKSGVVDMTKDFDKKQFRRWQGYIRAFEALEVRLTDRELTREQEKYMAKKAAKQKRIK